VIVKIYISQGSVATLLRCSGIFSNHFIRNCSQNVPVKKIENRPIFGEDMDKSLRLTFWPTLCGLLLGLLLYLPRC